MIESMNNVEEDDIEVSQDQVEEDGESGGRHVMISILNLVDLAGSEKADQTGAEGTRYNLLGLDRH